MRKVFVEMVAFPTWFPALSPRTSMAPCGVVWECQDMVPMLLEFLLGVDWSRSSGRCARSDGINVGSGREPWFSRDDTSRSSPLGARLMEGRRVETFTRDKYQAMGLPSSSQVHILGLKSGQDNVVGNWLDFLLPMTSAEMHKVTMVIAHRELPSSVRGRPKQKQVCRGRGKRATRERDCWQTLELI